MVHHRDSNQKKSEKNSTAHKGKNKITIKCVLNIFLVGQKADDYEGQKKEEGKNPFFWKYNGIGNVFVFH